MAARVYRKLTGREKRLQLRGGSHGFEPVYISELREIAKKTKRADRLARKGA